MLSSLSGDARGIAGPSPDALSDKLNLANNAINSFANDVTSNMSSLSASFQGDWLAYVAAWKTFYLSSSGFMARFFGPNEIDGTIDTYMSNLNGFKTRFASETNKQASMSTPNLATSSTVTSVISSATSLLTIGAVLAAIVVIGPKLYK